MITEYLVLAVTVFVVVATIPTLAQVGHRNLRVLVVLIDILISAGALAFAFDDVYQKIKDLQTMIGAIVGLVGLGLVAFWNADLARDRDERLHDEELKREARLEDRDQKRIANLVAAEFQILRETAQRYSKELERNARPEVHQETRKFIHRAIFADQTLSPPHGVRLSDLKILPVELVHLILPVYLYTRDHASMPMSFMESHVPINDQNMRDYSNWFSGMERLIAGVLPLLDEFVRTGAIPKNIHTLPQTQSAEGSASNSQG